MTIPRVTAVQSMVRVFFEDGTVAVVAVRPGLLTIDALRSDVPVDREELQQLVAAQLQAVQEHLQQQAPAEIYRYAKKTAGPRLQLRTAPATIPATEPNEGTPNVGSSEDPGHGPAEASGQ